ncbi:Wyosine [tRNA(Phe)-imidazoG37] synthetase, radical SAM superfamily [Thermodesulfobium acidiphilum]|uniref:Wyosine [tRNA(Phe)-imidazoG37] synthetase, radical SAM superfamily n=1 Tax=Thermodesulfobium acidiphilum TaxID=1794699 RepID=A0A2R4W1E6_THEAF|nr:radical SAM protein [Thermodesulfobium acidiphilum]AWB10498.1 Wyosine [tRNA(Phe)-imidazoG37] synthetase, radical SAM superfamily [Thermodesulfobium acidiphilum]
MQFLFGPVPSRRLGLSLGINIIPHKVCNFNCVYCEVGRTTNLINDRRSFYNPDEIEKDFRENYKRMGRFDFVTFSGSGEPTLNKDIGRLIKYVKSFNVAKIAVLTNGSLLNLTDVQEDLMDADVIIPSLDAANQESFRKINRPHVSLKIDEIINGIKEFRDKFKGEVWLEVLFVKSLNDSQKDIEDLKRAVKFINPHKFQIGTIDRPPAEENIKKLTNEELMRVYSELKDLNAELIKPFSEKNMDFHEFLELSIAKMVSIRPCSKEELMSVFGAGDEDITRILNRLLKEGKISQRVYEGKAFIVKK